MTQIPTVLSMWIKDVSPRHTIMLINYNSLGAGDFCDERPVHVVYTQLA